MTSMSRPAARAVGRQVADPLRGEAGGSDDLLGLHLGDPLADQFGLDRLEVDLLHAPGGLLGRKLGDLLEVGLGILVSGPEPFEVQDPEPTQVPDGGGGGGADGAVHGRAQHRKGEAEAVELPGDVDVVGVAGSPARDDGDVIQPVGLSSRLANADIDLHRGLHLSSA